MAQQHINYSTPNDGLGDTLRTSQVKAESNFNELYANKVDKVLGKVLSDTNYTQAEKDQLAALVAAGANVQSDWNQGDNLQPDYVKNKPTKVSEFFNDGDGTQPFVIDVGIVGTFARSAGEWVAIIGNVTSKRFAGLGQDYTLPTGSVAFKGWINDYPQHLEEVGFEADLNIFTQSGAIITFKQTIEAGDRIIIDYYL